jgi:hypothetical protein
VEEVEEVVVLEVEYLMTSYLNQLYIYSVDD